MKRFLVACIVISIFLLPAISFSDESRLEELAGLLMANNQLLLEQNQILKARMGAAVAQNNEARMTNVLLCQMQPRIGPKLIKRLCAAIMMEYEAVQKVLDAPEKKGEDS